MTSCLISSRNAELPLVRKELAPERADRNDRPEMTDMGREFALLLMPPGVGVGAVSCSGMSWMISLSRYGVEPGWLNDSEGVKSAKAGWTPMP